MIGTGYWDLVVVETVLPGDPSLLFEAGHHRAEDPGAGQHEGNEFGLQDGVAVGQVLEEVGTEAA